MCTGRPDAASTFRACAAVCDRPVATSHSATTPALRWKPSAQQTSTVPCLARRFDRRHGLGKPVRGRRHKVEHGKAGPAAGQRRAGRSSSAARSITVPKLLASLAVGKRPRNTPSVTATCAGSFRVHAQLIDPSAEPVWPEHDAAGQRRGAVGGFLEHFDPGPGIGEGDDGQRQAPATSRISATARG